ATSRVPGYHGLSLRTARRRAALSLPRMGDGIGDALDGVPGRKHSDPDAGHVPDRGRDGGRESNQGRPCGLLLGWTVIVAPALTIRAIRLPAPPPAVRISGLNHYFGTGATRKHALAHVNLTLLPG